MMSGMSISLLTQFCARVTNGHADRHIDGVHGGNGVGEMYPEGRMLLELCLGKELFVSDILVDKRFDVDNVCINKVLADIVVFFT